MRRSAKQTLTNQAKNLTFQSLHPFGIMIYLDLSILLWIFFINRILAAKKLSLSSSLRGRFSFFYFDPWILLGDFSTLALLSLLGNFIMILWVAQLSSCKHQLGLPSFFSSIRANTQRSVDLIIYNLYQVTRLPGQKDYPLGLMRIMIFGVLTT